MSLDVAVLVGVVLLVVAAMVRSGRVSRASQATQQQVLDRQAESMAVQRELLEGQKEMVRCLQIIAARERP